MNEKPRRHNYEASREYLAKNIYITVILVLLLFSISQFWNSFLQDTARKLLRVENLSYIQNLIVSLVITTIFIAFLYFVDISLIAIA